MGPRGDQAELSQSRLRPEATPPCAKLRFSLNHHQNLFVVVSITGCSCLDEVSPSPSPPPPAPPTLPPSNCTYTCGHVARTALSCPGASVLHARATRTGLLRPRARASLPQGATTVITLLHAVRTPCMVYSTGLVSTMVCTTGLDWSAWYTLHYSHTTVTLQSHYSHTTVTLQFTLQSHCSHTTVALLASLVSMVNTTVHVILPRPVV